jgi:hypothetical protein
MRKKWDVGMALERIGMRSEEVKGMRKNWDEKGME